jgi:hypothetical protein
LRRGVRSVIISDTDDLDPGGQEWDAHDDQPGKSAASALPFLVVEDELKTVATRDLQDDGDEREQASGPEVFVEGVYGATLHEETFCGEEGRDLCLGISTQVDRLSSGALP